MKQYYYNNFKNVIQSNFQGNKARIKYISSLVISLIDVATVKLSRISLRIKSGTKHQSNYRNLQRFFQNYKFNYDEYAKFVISLLPKKDKYFLVIDRTNWKFGKTQINVLMLGIIYKNNAIPLFWELLDKGGSSSTQERKDLLEKAIKLIGKERIEALLGDREFIGTDWFLYLLEKGIEFHIRIPKQIKKGSILEKDRKTINSVFKYLKPYGKLNYAKQIKVLGCMLYVSGMRTDNNEYCVVVSSKNNIDSLSKYQKRWTIESMFGAFKTRGFNFEDTHLKALDKIKKLIVIISIAYFWSIMIGIWLENVTPIKIKNHGRKSVSTFRYGFDYLTYIIKNVIDYYYEFITLTKILSCT